MPNPNRRCTNCHGNHGSRYLDRPSLYASRAANTLAIKTNKPYKEARREYEAINRLTKTVKVQLQRQIKEFKTKVENATHINQESEQMSSRALQDILEEMKAAQEKIQKDVAHLTKLKLETEKKNT